MHPLVSIVIPAFNNELHIAETLNSVLDQTYPNFEVIVSDHGSKDATLEIAKEFTEDPRVSIVVCSEAGGAAANWNFVSNLAKGEFIKLVCADDLLDPRSLDLQVAALQRFESAKMVSAPRRIVDTSGKTLFASRGIKSRHSLIRGTAAIKKTTRAGTNIFGEPACVLFRTEALRSAGWWQVDAEYLLDQSTYIEVLMHGDLAVLPETLASFRVSAGQWSFRLAKSQAAQARAFHHRLRQSHPEIISRFDLLLGNLFATLNASARRLIYMLLR